MKKKITDMKRVRRIRIAAAAVSFMLLVGMTVSCGKGKNGAIRVAALKGPTGIGMVRMMQQDAEREAPHYAFTLSSAPEDVKAGLLSGEYDIASIPTNLAALLYSKAGAKISVLGINTLGVLYILENGDTVHSAADLAGKTLYATGQGSTPEYILRYILEKNGIDPTEDIDIEYLTEHAELATRMSAGEIVLGMLPEPNVTSALLGAGDQPLRIALDLTAEWEKIAAGTTITQGCIVVRREFAEEHPEEVEAFIRDYEASAAFTASDPDPTAALCEEFGVIPKAALAKKALPNCNVVFLTGAEMKTKLEAFLGVLFEADASSIGGKLPDDAFYYGVK